MSEQEAFVVDSPEKAEWVMSKFKAANDAVADAKRRKAEFVANCDAIITRLEAEERDLRYRLEPDLLNFAKENTAKKKSYLTPYGQVAWRTVPARVAWEDKTSAAQWLATNHPDKVRIEVKHVPTIEPEEAPEGCPGITAFPETESVSIKFGESKERGML